jgi:hypothetical protein
VEDERRPLLDHVASKKFSLTRSEKKMWRPVLQGENSTTLLKMTNPSLRRMIYSRKHVVFNENR